jgi:outer membrane receptor for ferrienterochelin and colicins
MKYYFDQATLEFQLAHVFHKQDSDYEGEYYLGRQHILHGSLQLHLPFGKRYSLVAGTSYRKELLWENLARSEYDYDNLGVFAEGSLRLGKWEWLHGARFNYHNEFGSVVTPRTALRFSPTKNLVLRGSVGTGFRAPTTFYEYFHGVHPGGYSIDMQADEPEQSVGIQFSLAWQFHRFFAFTLEAAQNVVSHAIGLEQNNDGTVVTVFNAEEEFRVRSLEGKLEFRLHPFEVQVGGSAVQIDDDAGVMSMAQPTLSFTGSLSWHRGPFALDLNGRVVGPADLRKVYGYAYNPNTVDDPNDLLDPETGANLGSLKRAKSPWWGLANLRARYKLADGLELYGEIENLLDFHQSDVEGNLMYPTDGPGGEAGPINVTYLWGPLKGRTFYLGAKFTY